jgi:hypothetical protein
MGGASAASRSFPRRRVAASRTSPGSSRISSQISQGGPASQVIGTPIFISLPGRVQNRSVAPSWGTRTSAATGGTGQTVGT